MFWRKAAKTIESPAPAQVSPVAPESGASLDDALDAAAEMLRALGRHAFPIGEEDAGSIGKAFERCAEHVLVVAPLDTSSRNDEAQPSSKRQWRRVVRFVADHRKKEQAYVERSTKEAREAIWALVDGLGRACVEHGKADQTLRSQAARLGQATAAESLTDIKREATAFAATVVAFLEQQNQRLQEQTRDLRERLARLETQLDEAKREGGTDALTRLANRRVFDATLAQQTALATVTGRPLSLVLFDVDHFKAVNDRYGHPAGDQVLREIADAAIRAFPRRTDVVSRYGGEELAVILPDTTGASARMLAERMLSAIRSHVVDVGGARVSVTVSAGVAGFTFGDGPAELIAIADRRLYVAKQSGRDRVVENDDVAPRGARPETSSGEPMESWAAAR